MMSLEDARTRTLLRGDELRSKLGQLVEKTHLAVKDGSQKYDDLISHWVLGLAFCGTEELRRRFLQFEVDLFYHRFSTLLPSEVRKFVENEELKYVPITDAERDGMTFNFGNGEFSNPLEDVFKCNNLSLRTGEALAAFANTQYYKIPFTKVGDLVAMRRVFIRNGTAFVSQSDLISALSSQFRTELAARLETAARSLPWVAKDDRMGPLIQKLQTASLGNDMSSTSVTSRSGQVRLADISALAKRSFPLCARNLENALTKEHHLKYDSRLQYTLFLKGIGLSMDETIAYFQSEFAKKPTSPEEFRKKGYTYGIKHAFGQEGKRANYTPWSCSRAIGKNQTAPDQRHGCPFKEFTPERVGQMAKETGVSESDIRRVVDLTKEHHFQIACRLHWELLHPGGNAEPVGNHPNQWFDESMKYYDEKAKKEADKAGGGAAAAFATTTSTGVKVAASPSSDD